MFGLNDDLFSPPAAWAELRVGALSALRTNVGAASVEARQYLAHRRHRGSEQVRAEYEAGEWKKRLQAAPWNEAASLDAYTSPGDASPQLVRWGPHLYRVPKVEYYRARRRLLIDMMRERLGHLGVVAELGCGWGFNLLSLATRESWDRMEGYDVSPNGIAAAREAAKRFDLTSCTFDRIDLTDAGDPSFPQLRGKGVFTWYCLEQLPHATLQVLRNIRSAGPARVVHVEPTTEMLAFSQVADWATYFYNRRKDLQNSIVRSLREMERQGEIRLLECRRLDVSPSHKHYPILATWEPTTP